MAKEKQLTVNFLSREEFAGRLQISISTLTRYRNQGRVTPVKLGKFLKFKNEDVEILLKSFKSK